MTKVSIKVGRINLQIEYNRPGSSEENHEWLTCAWIHDGKIHGVIGIMIRRLPVYTNTNRQAWLWVPWTWLYASIVYLLTVMFTHYFIIGICHKIFVCAYAYTCAALSLLKTFSICQWDCRFYAILRLSYKRVPNARWKVGIIKFKKNWMC